MPAGADLLVMNPRRAGLPVAGSATGKLVSA
jgi:hypothetical protein